MTLSRALALVLALYFAHAPKSPILILWDETMFFAAVFFLFGAVADMKGSEIQSHYSPPAVNPRSMMQSFFFLGGEKNRRGSSANGTTATSRDGASNSAVGA